MNWPVKTYLFYFFGILLMVSAALYLTEWTIVPYLYAAACVGLAALFLMTPYKGDNFRLKRLNIQQAIAALMLPVSAWLMYSKQNEWMVCLLVSSLLLTYVVFIRDYEEKKNKPDGTDNKPAK
ncbi:MAG: hypothetical protein LBG77_03710 [Dysgonamonadaceae bacterium]|jgi:Ca2+/Na+ antiporter|nr:hypothetical protein [Dysgonamonadaceae bacterium]